MATDSTYGNLGSTVSIDSGTSPGSGSSSGANATENKAYDLDSLNTSGAGATGATGISNLNLGNSSGTESILGAGALDRVLAAPEVVKPVTTGVLEDVQDPAKSTVVDPVSGKTAVAELREGQVVTKDDSEQGLTDKIPETIDAGLALGTNGAAVAQQPADEKKTVVESMTGGVPVTVDQLTPARGMSQADLGLVSEPSVLSLFSPGEGSYRRASYPGSDRIVSDFVNGLNTPKSNGVSQIEDGTFVGRLATTAAGREVAQELLNVELGTSIELKMLMDGKTLTDADRTAAAATLKKVADAGVRFDAVSKGLGIDSAALTADDREKINLFKSTVGGGFSTLGVTDLNKRAAEFNTALATAEATAALEAGKITEQATVAGTQMAAKDGTLVYEQNVNTGKWEAKKYTGKEVSSDTIKKQQDAYKKALIDGVQRVGGSTLSMDSEETSDVVPKAVQDWANKKAADKYGVAYADAVTRETELTALAARQSELGNAALRSLGNSMRGTKSVFDATGISYLAGVKNSLKDEAGVRLVGAKGTMVSVQNEYDAFLMTSASLTDSEREAKAEELKMKWDGAVKTAIKSMENPEAMVEFSQAVADSVGVADAVDTELGRVDAVLSRSGIQATSVTGLNDSLSKAGAGVAELRRLKSVAEEGTLTLREQDRLVELKRQWDPSGIAMQQFREASANLVAIDSLASRANVSVNAASAALEAAHTANVENAKVVGASGTYLKKLGALYNSTSTRVKAIDAEVAILNDTIKTSPDGNVAGYEARLAALRTEKNDVLNAYTDGDTALRNQEESIYMGFATKNIYSGETDIKMELLLTALASVGSLANSLVLEPKREREKEERDREWWKEEMEIKFDYWQKQYAIEQAGAMALAEEDDDDDDNDDGSSPSGNTNVQLASAK